MPATPVETVRLWPGKVAPGSESWTQKQKTYQMTAPFNHVLLRNVVDPTLDVYLPSSERATGVGIIICPGGGHMFLASEHEGSQVAEWFASRGIAAFVLHYRVMESPEDDAEFVELRGRLAEVLRERLAGISRLRLQMGSKPSGLFVKERRNGESIRARLGCWGSRRELIYPTRLRPLLPTDRRTSNSTLSPPSTAHSGDPTPPSLPPHHQCGQQLPPTIPSRSNRALISIQPGTERATAEIHVSSKGAHGFGMHKQGLPCDGWIEQFYAWLVTHGIVEAGKGGKV